MRGSLRPPNAGKLTHAQRVKGGKKSAGRTPEWLKELARERTEEAIKTLAEIMRGKKQAGRSRVAAAEALLNRGWGQAKQSMEISTPQDQERVEALEAALAGELGLVKGKEAT